MSTLRLVSRREWRAAPPRYGLVPFTARPAGRLFGHHSVTSTYGTDWARAARVVQEVAFGRGFSDVSYPVLIHPPTGTVLEGRGPQWVGAHTAGYNSTTLAICFLGNYDVSRLPDAGVEAFRWAVGFLKATGFLAGDAPIDPHRAVSSTACPGRFVVARLGELRRPWSGSLFDDGLDLGGLTVADLTRKELAQWLHDRDAHVDRRVAEAEDRLLGKLWTMHRRRADEAAAILAAVKGDDVLEALRAELDDRDRALAEQIAETVAVRVEAVIEEADDEIGAEEVGALVRSELRTELAGVLAEAIEGQD